MIVSGAENVYPLDLENILGQHPGIDSVAIVGIPDDEFGQRLKASVVRQSGNNLDSESLIQWLRPRVARFQMPAQVEFLDQLPLTSLGKVDRRALRNDPYP
jgi:acyl-CoA synthetase (AMP-forming)/AMP-acid ligase II